MSTEASAAPSAESTARLFTITELAAEFDITPRAIRFYEDMGLLEPSRSGRNRVYTHRDRTRPASRSTAGRSLPRRPRWSAPSIAGTSSAISKGPFATRSSARTSRVPGPCRPC